MKYQIELISKISMEIEAETAKEAIAAAKKNAGPEYDLFEIINEKESQVEICEFCEKDIDLFSDHYTYGDGIYYHNTCLAKKQ